MNKKAPRFHLVHGASVDRTDYLCQLCANKRVLHLACAAWPDTQTLLQHDLLLHTHLARVTKTLAGVDLSEEGISVLREHGCDHLAQADLLIATDWDRIWNQLPWRPEIIVAGELIEHLDAPGQILRLCADRMEPSSELYITVPNAFSAKGIIHMMSGREKVAPDHVAYYSQQNLFELARRNGLTVKNIRYYRNREEDWKGRALHALLWPVYRLWPQLGDGLIARCAISSE